MAQYVGYNAAKQYMRHICHDFSVELALLINLLWHGDPMPASRFVSD